MKVNAATLITAALVIPSLAAPLPAGGSEEVKPRQSYTDYGSYTGTYTTYGDYDGAGSGSSSSSSGGYSSYGSYPTTYTTYGSYRRALDWVKGLFA